MNAKFEPLQLRILEVVAFGFVDGIAQVVVGNFIGHHVTEFQAEVVGEFKKQDGDIGDFGCNLVAFLFEARIDLIRLLPDEVLHQFTGFGGDGDGKVFRVVKLPPFTGIHKGLDACGKG